MSQLYVTAAIASLVQLAARQFHNLVQKSESREFDPHTGHVFDNLSGFLYKNESVSFYRTQRILSVFLISDMRSKEYILIHKI